MANGYYRGGGSRTRGGVTAYRGPTQIQTESFFNPVPVEFMLGEINRRQQAFDVSYAGALAAKDELAQQQVGMVDLADKNRIIKEGMSNIDSLVQDKYGGDWGRAAKAVAGQVTAVRENPFWNAQKEAQKQREIAQELKIKYGPDALIFSDPTTLSVLDEQGRVRGAEAFQPDIIQKGDYATTARQIMSAVKADASSFGLSQVEADGLEHFLQTGKTQGITEEKIRGLAQDPRVQQLFLGRHGEIGRAGQLSEAQQRQHGFFGKTPEQFAEEQLMGAGLPMIHQQTDLRYVQDPLAVARYKSGLEAQGAGYSPSATRQSFETVSQNKLHEHQRRLNMANLPIEDELPGPFSLLKPDEIPGSEAKARTEADRQADLDKYYKDLVKEHPELGELKRDDAFAAYEDWITNQSEQSTLAWNMKLEDSAANIKSNLVSNLNQADFAAAGVTASGDVFGKKNISKELGYNNWQEFVGAFSDGKIEVVPQVDFLNGAMALTVPANPNRPRRGRPVTLNFQTDQQTRNMIQTGHDITSQYYDSKTYDGTDEKPLLDRDGNPTGIGLAVKGSGNILDGNQKVVIMTDYNSSPPRSQVVRLEDVQGKIAQTIDVRYNNFQGKLGNPGKLD